jgi:DNA modification methylase
LNERTTLPIPSVRPDNVVRFSTAGASRDNLIKHPAPYHKDLPLYYINLLTDEGDIVLDPFLGSGTTLIACEKLQRFCYGIELDPKYCDVIIKRWQQFTGKEAIHEQSGKTYNSI